MKKDSIHKFVWTNYEQGFVTILLFVLQISFTYCKVASYNATEQHPQ